MNEMDLKFDKIIFFPAYIFFFGIFEMLFDSLDVYLRHTLEQRLSLEYVLKV